MNTLKTALIRYHNPSKQWVLEVIYEPRGVTIKYFKTLDEAISFLSENREKAQEFISL